MTKQSSLSIHTCVKIFLGNKLVDQGNNQIVDNGLEFTANCWGGVFPTGKPYAPVSHIGIGQAGDPTTASMVALETEHNRRALSTGYPAINGSTIEFAATWPENTPRSSTGVTTIREIGLFTGATGNNMLARYLPQLISKDNNMPMTIVWSLEIKGREA